MKMETSNNKLLFVKGYRYGMILCNSLPLSLLWIWICLEESLCVCVSLSLSLSLSLSSLALGKASSPCGEELMFPANSQKGPELGSRFSSTSAV